MASVKFSHPKVGTLTLKKTGMNGISWSYDMNVANFPTYGGEVIQILSIFIDDMTIEGEVTSHKEMERIYQYFAKYMVEASQGNSGTGSFNQEFMTMTYPSRGWTFAIQPLAVPGFTYSRDTVIPKWQMMAHVVDEEEGNYQTLKEMTGVEATKQLNEVGEGEPFNLKGIISMAAGDPANNPFSAPGQYKNEKFTATTKAETEAELKDQADWYNSLLPAYLSGDYSALEGDIAKPAFGHKQTEETSGGSQEHINNATKEAEGTAHG